MEEYWKIALEGDETINKISEKYNLNSYQKFLIRNSFTVFLYVFDSVVEENLRKDDKNTIPSERKDN